MRKKAFTLLELVLVVVVIGILATIGISQYFPLRERAFDKEAIINLKLIAAAEKIYKAKYHSYVNCNNTSEVNDILGLSLPAANWDYKVVDATNTTFTAKARRRATPTRYWCINQTEEEPYQTGCSW